MVKLADIVDKQLVAREIEAGYIRMRVHPLYPELVSLNYTEKTQFEKHWNDATRITRGLIYNQWTGDVLARPFQKIHNFDEAEAPNIAWDQIVYHWSDKVDGSLGIVYRNPDGLLEVATRGSFESEQAKHATTRLRYMEPTLHEQFLNDINNGYTPLVEIVYPENRIVVDYGEVDALFYLGSIDNADGMFIPPFRSTYQPRKFSDLMMDLSRPNSEGWVVWGSAYKAVKIKQADYIELHRIVTGLNRKSVWRALSEGFDVYTNMLQQLPDELFNWAKGVGSELAHAYGYKVMEIDRWYLNVLEHMEDHNIDTNDRKGFALAVKLLVPQALQGYMFSLADSKDISAKVWRSLEPEGGDMGGYRRDEGVVIA